MESDERTGAQLVASAVLGALLFQPMVIKLFDRGPDATLAGIPYLFLYLFAAWAVVIALISAAILSHDGFMARPGRDGIDEDTEEGAPRRR